MSLRWRSLLALAMVFAVALVFTGGAGYYAVGSIRAHYGAALAKTASMLRKQRLDNRLNREMGVSSRMAGLSATRDWLADETSVAKKAHFLHEAEGFRRLMDDHAYWVVSNRTHAYYFVDAPIAAPSWRPDRVLVAADPRDAWYLPAPGSGTGEAVEVSADAQSGRTTVLIKAPVRDGRALLGMAGTEIDLSRLLRDFTFAGQAGITNLLIDRHGDIQARGAPNEASIPRSERNFYHLLTPGDQRALLDAEAELRGDHEGVRLLSVALNGKPRLLGVSWVPLLDWCVVSAVDLDVTSRPDGRLLASLVAGGVALVIVLGLLVMLAIDRTLLAPLSQLHRSVKQIASGDYHIRLDATRHDELGDLTRAVNGMAAEISSHTETLEHRIEERTRALTEANQQVVLVHQAIQDSIRYASLIQELTLPHDRMASLLGEQHFLLWKPRDVVGGDFYVFCADEERYLLGVFDCAGHGVPGAFMTLIAQSAFDKAVAKVGFHDPAAILTRMDRLVPAMLRGAAEAQRLATSMDAGLCVVDRATGDLTFAGARLSLLLSNGERCKEIHGDRRSVADRKPGAFSNHHVPYQPGGSFYLATDGLLDQSGGDQGYGFGRRRLAELALRCAGRPMPAQKQTFEDGLAAWQGAFAQRDDITVLGFSADRLRPQNQHLTNGDLNASS